MTRHADKLAEWQAQRVLAWKNTIGTLAEPWTWRSMLDGFLQGDRSLAALLLDPAELGMMRLPDTTGRYRQRGWPSLKGPDRTFVGPFVDEAAEQLRQDFFSPASGYGFREFDDNMQELLLRYPHMFPSTSSGPEFLNLVWEEMRERATGNRISEELRAAWVHLTEVLAVDVNGDLIMVANGSLTHPEVWQEGLDALGRVLQGMAAEPSGRRLARLFPSESFDRFDLDPTDPGGKSHIQDLLSEADSIGLPVDTSGGWPTRQQVQIGGFQLARAEAWAAAREALLQRNTWTPYHVSLVSDWLETLRAHANLGGQICWWYMDCCSSCLHRR